MDHTLSLHLLVGCLKVFETSRQHERHIADLTSSYERQAESINIRLAGFRAASKRYKARAEQAFSDVGHSIKVYLYVKALYWYSISSFFNAESITLPTSVYRLG